MSYSVFELEISTINGQILSQPVVQRFRCDFVLPQQVQVVRQYNANECIVAISVFLFNYAGDLFGTKEVDTVQKFLDIRNARCVTNECCYLLDSNGCILTINGIKITV